MPDNFGFFFLKVLGVRKKNERKKKGNVCESFKYESK
jgi:hypothetical protein